MFSPAGIRLVGFVSLLSLLIALPNCARAQAVMGPADDGVTTFFGLTSGGLIIGFEFLTDDGNTIVESVNGKCIQRINAPKATIAVLSSFGQLFAVGEGNLNVHATVDCDTHAYNYERVVVTAVGEVIDNSGQPYRMHVYAVIVGGIAKVANISFEPI
jgi:hypothetical protein